jgi:hypothetical protein
LLEGGPIVRFPGFEVTSLASPRFVGLALGCVLSAAASAQELAPQPPKQQGGFFVPMLTVAETHDDNLFFTQFPEADFVTRAALGVQTGYRSTAFTIDVQASRAADFFSRHPEFDTTHARTLGQVALTYLPARPLTVSVFACYLDTRTPSELNLVSGLAVGRSLATRISANPLLEYRLGSLSTLTGAFPVAHDTLDGRISDTMTGILGFDRRISKRDTLSFRYEHRWFDFSGGDKTERSTADVVTAGWLGEVGERTLLLLRAGPRYGKGELTVEVLATMKRRVKRGLVTLTYSKSQATTLGKTGVLDTQSIVASFALRVRKNLEIASGPGVYRNSLRGQPLNALRLNLETLWHFSPWFHLGASYSYDMQQPDFGIPGTIRRGAFQLKLLTSPQQRRPEPIATDAAAGESE